MPDDPFDSYHVATNASQISNAAQYGGTGSGFGGSNETKAVPYLKSGPVVRPNPTKMGMVLPPQFAYSAIYNITSQVYRTWQDEAQRNSLSDALAMWRDPFMRGLLKRRVMPVIDLPFSLEVDDPKDPEQKKIAEELTRIVEATPNFGYFKLSILYKIWYGRAAAQCDWNWKMINGRRRVCTVKHYPVQGDKIIARWPDVPAILVYGGFDPGANNRKNLILTDRGLALLLADPYFRERFVIGEFEPTDKDWLFETEQAAAIHGDGLRAQCYWSWWLRQELISYMTDGLQRISANGMLYAYYPSGNPAAQQAVIDALRELIRDNICAFPREPGETDQGPLIQTIPPSSVAYDILFNLIKHLEGIITQMFLGHGPESEQYAAGVESQDAQKSLVVRYDANNLAQILTEEWLRPMIRFNQWEYHGRKYYLQNLPFNIRFKFQMAPPNVKDLIENAVRLMQANVPLDLEEVRDTAGYSPPKDLEAYQAQQQQQQAQQQGGPEQGQQPPGRFGNAQGQPQNGNGAPHGETNGLPKMKPLPNETKGGATEESKLQPMKALPAVGESPSKTLHYRARFNRDDLRKLRSRYAVTNGKPR